MYFVSETAQGELRSGRVYAPEPRHSSGNRVTESVGDLKLTRLSTSTLAGRCSLTTGCPCVDPLGFSVSS